MPGQEPASRNGGSAHPSDKMAYRLKALVGISGEYAVFELNGVTKRFPRNECFDPNEARGIACLLAAGINP